MIIYRIEDSISGKGAFTSGLVLKAMGQYDFITNYTSPIPREDSPFNRPEPWEDSAFNSICDEFGMLRLEYHFGFESPESLIKWFSFIPLWPRFAKLGAMLCIYEVDSKHYIRGKEQVAFIKNEAILLGKNRFPENPNLFEKIVLQKAA